MKTVSPSYIALTETNKPSYGRFHLLVRTNKQHSFSTYGFSRHIITSVVLKFKLMSNSSESTLSIIWNIKCFVSWECPFLSLTFSRLCPADRVKKKTSEKVINSGVVVNFSLGERAHTARPAPSSRICPYSQNSGCGPGSRQGLGLERRAGDLDVADVNG